MASCRKSWKCKSFIEALFNILFQDNRKALGDTGKGRLLLLSISCALIVNGIFRGKPFLESGRKIKSFK